MTSLPPPVLPNAFVYDVVFIGVLAVVLELVALLPFLRRVYFGAVLILIGIIEFALVAHTGYSIPLELFLFGIPMVTIVSGIIVPIFYAIRRLLNKKAKLLLIFSGCVELALGAISLLNMDVRGFPTENGFLIAHVNSQLFLLGTVLSTVAVYSVAIGTFLFMTKPKK